MLEIPEEGQVGTGSHKVCYALPGKAMAIYTYIHIYIEREREREREIEGYIGIMEKKMETTI